MNDIVPVSHIDNFQIIQTAPVLPYGKNIGHDLTGVIVIGEAVDHRNGGILSEFQNVRMLEKPGHDDVVVPADDARSVLDDFPFSEFDVLGTTVQLLREGQPLASRRCATDGSYLSSSDPRIVFGLGDSTETGTIRVRWPDGSEDVWEGLAADRYHRLRKGSTTARVDATGSRLDLSGSLNEQAIP